MPKERWNREESFVETDWLKREPTPFVYLFPIFKANALSAEHRYNLRTQPPLWRVLCLERVTQSLAGFGLHAAAVPLGPLLQLRLEPIFDVPNKNLRHSPPHCYHDSILS